ncbi:hypothetical protein pb186bvf_012450 [Paramecium bursaria]
MIIIYTIIYNIYQLKRTQQNTQQLLKYQCILKVFCIFSRYLQQSNYISKYCINSSSILIQITNQNQLFQNSGFIKIYYNYKSINLIEHQLDMYQIINYNNIKICLANFKLYFVFCKPIQWLKPKLKLLRQKLNMRDFQNSFRVKCKVQQYKPQAKNILMHLNPDSKVILNMKMEANNLVFKLILSQELIIYMRILSLWYS